MEGETIKKKYSSILDMLKKERLTFTNQLEVARPDHLRPAETIGGVWFVLLAIGAPLPRPGYH